MQIEILEEHNKPNTKGYNPEYEIKSVDPVILKCKYCEFEFSPE